jgi:WD40 repeat protein
MSDAFISYSRHDREFVVRLHQSLADAGKDVWVDWEDIPPTVDWREELTTGIEGADAFISVLTQASLRSDVCANELALGVEHGKRIIPILREEPNGTPVPEELASRNWTFFRDQDSYEEAVAKLVTALDTDIHAVRTHTRLQVRSGEWDRHERDRSFLLSGSDLATAEAWVASQSDQEPGPTRLQREYVIASRQSAARRQRRLLAGVSVALAVSVVLAIIALVQRGTAIDERNQASSRGLASAAVASLASNPELSTLLATEAVRRKATPQADEALRRAVGEDQTRAILTGHRGPVDWTAYSPDGRLVATASRDGTARIWRASDGRQLFVLRQGGNVLKARFNVQGNLLATSSTDGTARVWRVSDGRAVAVMREPGRAPIVDVAFGAHSTLLTASGDGYVKVWNATNGHFGVDVYHSVKSNGQPDPADAMAVPVGSPYVVTGYRSGVVLLYNGVRVLRLRGHTDLVSSVETSADGSLIVTGSGDGTARVWRDDGKLVAVLRGAPAGFPVFHAAISPDGRHVVTTALGTSALWDVRTQKKLATLEGHSGIVDFATFSPDSKFFATTSDDDTARVWLTAGSGQGLIPAGQPLTLLGGHTGDVRSAAFSPDGRFLATASVDGTARIWESSPGRTLVRVDQAGAENAALSPDGHLLATRGGGSHAVIVTNVDSGKVVASLGNGGSAHGPTLGLLDSAGTVAFSPDGRLVAWSNYHVLFVRSLAPGGQRVDLTEVGPKGAPIRHIAFSPDGRRIAAANGAPPGSRLNAARIWDVHSGRRIAVLSGHGAELNWISFSPGGRRVVTASDDGTARVWDASTGSQLAVLRGHHGAVLEAAFSPDGRRVVTAGIDVTARVWSLDGRQLLSLAGGDSSASFSRDGRFILTGNGNGTATTWNARTGALLTVMRGHEGFIQDAELSPDGRTALTASGDGTARVWDVKTGQQLAVLGGFTDTVFKASFSANGWRILAVSYGVARVFACDVCGSLRRLKSTAQKLVPRSLRPAERQKYLAGA